MAPRSAQPSTPSRTDPADTVVVRGVTVAGEWVLPDILVEDGGVIAGEDELACLVFIGDVADLDPDAPKQA